MYQAISYCADPALYVVIVRVSLPFSLQLLSQNHILVGVWACVCMSV